MTNWATAGKELFEWLILMAKVLLLVVVVMLAFQVWKFMFGFKESAFSRVALTSSSESDLVVTGFAQVDLLYLKRSRKEILIPSQESALDFDRVVNEEFGKAKEFCLHSYEVVFGYPSLSAEREKAPQPEEPPVAEPSIVAINTLRTENAPDSSTTWCQLKNVKSEREELKQALLYALEYDEVLHTHKTHGQMVLATVLDMAKAQCRGISPANAENQNLECLTHQLTDYWKNRAEKTRAALSELKTENIVATQEALKQFVTPEKKLELENALNAFKLKALGMERRLSADERAADFGADVASLVLTFSTTLGVSQERKRYLGLWTSKRFYLQRDIAKVYYGVSLSPSSIRTEKSFFNPDRMLLEFSKPDIIAFDRYSSFVVARNKIEKRYSANQSMANYLNQKMLENLQSGISRFHNRAVQAAENILIGRIPHYFDLADMEYEVVFKPRQRSEPDMSFLPGVLDLEPSEVEGE